MRAEPEFEREHPIDDCTAKPRRLADCSEGGRQFEIQMVREHIYVPVRARYDIEHDGVDVDVDVDEFEEIEFQVEWES